jgi:hypothetical protein
MMDGRIGPDRAGAEGWTCAPGNGSLVS